MKHPCETCKFADWERTSNGRLHPGGHGKCTWKKKIQLPESFWDFSLRSVIDSKQIQLKGGALSRKKGEEMPKLPFKCKTYQRK